MLLKEGIDKYLAWKAQETRTASKSYRKYLTNFLEHVGNIETKKITLDDITLFRESLKNRYRDSNISNHCNVIKNFFKYLEATRQSNIHPFLIKNPRFIPRQPPFATREDVSKMLSVYNTSTFEGLQKIVAIRLLWESMVRVSELVDLNIADIHQVQPFTEIVGKKNYQRRWIVWSDATHKLLVRFMRLRWKKYGGHEALFVSIRLRDKKVMRLTTRSVERWIEHARKKSKIEKQLSCHSLRHGGGHELAQKGATLKMIGTALGHSETNPRAGMQYLRFNKEESVEIMKKYCKIRFK